MILALTLTYTLTAWAGSVERWALGSDHEEASPKYAGVHCFVFDSGTGKILNNGFPVESDRCSKEIPKLTYFEMHHAQDLGSNDKYEGMHCYEFSAKTRRVINNAFPVEFSKCGVESEFTVSASELERLQAQVPQGEDQEAQAQLQKQLKAIAQDEKLSPEQKDKLRRQLLRHQELKAKARAQEPVQALARSKHKNDVKVRAEADPERLNPRLISFMPQQFTFGEYDYYDLTYLNGMPQATTWERLQYELAKRGAMFMLQSNEAARFLHTFHLKEEATFKNLGNSIFLPAGNTDHFRAQHLQNNIKEGPKNGPP